VTGTGKLSSSATSSSLEDLRHSYGSNTWKPTRTWVGRFTKAILCENLQVKWHRPHGAPWSSTGLYYDHKNPSMWTHCLGNNPNKQRDQPRSIFWLLVRTLVVTDFRSVCQWFASGLKACTKAWGTIEQHVAGAVKEGADVWIRVSSFESPW